MSNCKRKTGLEVHHRNRYGAATPSNGIALCGSCHDTKPSSHTPRDKRRTYYPFNAETIKEVKKNAGYKCQCGECENCLK